MSKELEALRNNVDIKKALGFAQSCGYHADVQYALEKAVKLERLFTLMADLTNTNTPPTADELCEEYYQIRKTPLVYDKVLKVFTEIKGGRARGKIIARLRVGNLDIPHILPPTIIKRIAQFYEAEVKENENNE